MHRVTIEGHVMAAVAYQLLIYRSGWPELQLVMQCLYVCMITKGKGSLDDLRKLTKLSCVCFSFSESLEVRKKTCILQYKLHSYVLWYAILLQFY